MTLSPEGIEIGRIRQVISLCPGLLPVAKNGMV